MVFCWVPPGEATLGSPNEEKWRHGDEGDRAFKTKGFWLGKYEVTQDEWKAVMGKNPSAFNGTRENGVRGEKTGRYPVDSVRWDDIQPFLKQLNARPGARSAFGTAGRFVLPHEDEWEYAARAGHTDRRPFYWGSSLNGTEANVNGASPYGTEVKGGYLKRPTAVGSYEAIYPHPWGLCDLHGNVCEWCDNKHEQYGDYIIIRGGGWYTSAWNSRAAYRSKNAPASFDGEYGFRVVFRPD